MGFEAKELTGFDSEIKTGSKDNTALIKDDKSLRLLSAAGTGATLHPPALVFQDGLTEREREIQAGQKG